MRLVLPTTLCFLFTALIGCRTPRKTYYGIHDANPALPTTGSLVKLHTDSSSSPERAERMAFKGAAFTIPDGWFLKRVPNYKRTAYTTYYLLGKTPGFELSSPAIFVWPKVLGQYETDDVQFRSATDINGSSSLIFGQYPSDSYFIKGITPVGRIMTPYGPVTVFERKGGCFMTYYNKYTAGEIKSSKVAVGFCLCLSPGDKAKGSMEAFDQVIKSFHW